MTSLATAISLFKLFIPLMTKVIEWIQNGVSNDEIRKRMSDPSHVGDDMLDRIKQRLDRGRDLLGRDPKPPG